jgi:integrase
MDTATNTVWRVTPWNKGKLLGQKPPLKLKEIWAIRIRLQLDRRARELALFNLAIDSKLRGCDLVGLRVHDVVQGSRVAPRAIVMQTKTELPVQFEITEQTRDAIAACVMDAHLKSEQFLFPSRVSQSPHLSTRQYSRIVGTWIASIGMNPAAYGTHSLRRTAKEEPMGRLEDWAARWCRRSSRSNSCRFRCRPTPGRRAARQAAD